MDRNYKNLFGFTLALQMFSPIAKKEGKEILYSLDNEESTFLFHLIMKIENRDELTCSYSIPSLWCPWLTDKESPQRALFWFGWFLYLYQLFLQHLACSCGTKEAKHIKKHNAYKKQNIIRWGRWVIIPRLLFSKRNPKWVKSERAPPSELLQYRSLSVAVWALPCLLPESLWCTCTEQRKDGG